MKLFPTLFLLVLAIPTFAAPKIDPRAVELLDKAAKSYGALQGLEMKIATTELSTIQRESMEGTVELGFQRPNLLRVNNIISNSTYLWIFNNEGSVFSDEKASATIKNEKLTARLTMRLVGVMSGLGMASLFENQIILSDLLESRNPLRQHLPSGLLETRFLEARIVGKNTCEGLQWREKSSDMDGRVYRAEWTTWFNSRDLRITRVQTRIRYDNSKTTRTIVREIQSRDNPTFAPNYFQWTAPSGVKVQTFGKPKTQNEK